MQAGEPIAARSARADASRLIETMAVGYAAIDRWWRITNVNVTAEEILGVASDDVVGRDVWQGFPGARELAFGAAFESVMGTGVPAAFDAWYPARSIWLEVRVQPMADGIACYFLDITARRLADQRANEAVEQARLVRDVTDALTSSLDILANVAQLTRLVLPYLGTWSIVTLADDTGTLTDTSSWHVDPARRADVERYANARLSALRGTIAEEAVLEHRPIGLMDDAHAAIRARMTPGRARELLDVLAPRAAAVLPMVARGRTVGMLTIYGDTPMSEAQFELAKDIASRAALSIDNSIAYERARLARIDAEAARVEAEQANQWLALLAQVSDALAGMPDPNVAVGRLADLVVPLLADWSLVTVVDEDLGLRDIGAAHRDPARVDEVAAYAARRSHRMSDSAPLAVALRTREPVLIANLSDERLTSAQLDPELARIARGLQPHGLAVLPLMSRSRVFGFLTLVTTHQRGSHTAEEITTALEVARRAGPVLDGARSAHRARALAESMQRSVLAVPPVGPGLQIGTRYRPAQLDNEVGGDWYDHFDLPDGSTVVTIGDVMGHDSAATAAMAQLRTFMRATAWTGRHSPAEVLADTDSASRKLGPGTFATAVTGELEPARADGSVVFRWSNAGHLPPMLVLPDGTVRVLWSETADVPLGVLASATRRDHSAVLPAGSVLLLYTDGLVERREHDLDAGLAELCVALKSVPGRELDDVLDELLHEAGGGDAHSDDIALLAVRIGENSPELGHGTAVLSVELPFEAAASGAARERLSHHTRSLAPDLAADAALLASELVSNALRHGNAPIGLHVESWATGVRVSVSDAGPTYRLPTLRLPSAEKSSGRGLMIIDALATSWGITPASVGKSVWFVVGVEREPN